MAWRAALLATVLCVPVGAGATPAAARIAVEIGAPPVEAPWLAAAVEQSIARELSRFQRVKVIDAGQKPPSSCRVGDLHCRVGAWTRAGADVVILGRLSAGKVRYGIYTTWDGARAAGGSIDVDEGTRPADVRRDIAALVRRLVANGGLIDQGPLAGVSSEELAEDLVAGASGWSGPEAQKPGAKGSGAGASAAGAPGAAGAPAGGAAAVDAGATLPEPPSPFASLPWIGELVALQVPPAARLQIALMLLILFFALPPLFARTLVGSTALAAHEPPASWKWTFVLVIGLTVVLVALGTTELLPQLEHLHQELGAQRVFDLILPLCGGLLWAGLALASLDLMVPRLHGIERARPDALLRLLGGWLWLFLQRAVLLALYLPVFALALWAGDKLGVPERLHWMLVVPIVGLGAYLWFLTLVDNLAVYLDEAVVLGQATTKNPWHPTMARYIAASARRAGLDLNHRVSRRTLFLPGRVHGLVTYGGGFARPRVVVAAEIREVALGELPDEIESTEGAANLDALHLGSIVPNDPAPERKTQRRADKDRRRLPRPMAMLARPRAAAPRLLGENATLLGWVRPSTLLGTVGLISNTNDDLRVVHELLTEHYAAFDRSLLGEDHDDSDPRRKDFLFGALVREIGVVQRHDSMFATITLALRMAKDKLPRPFPSLVHWLDALHRRFGARMPTMLADAHAALNLCGDLMAQHLFYVMTSREDLLTSRADAPTLFRTSRAIYAAIAEDKTPGSTVEPTPKNRLLWLSQLSVVPLPVRQSRVMRAVTWAVPTLVVLAALGLAVRQAVRYHPTYVDRLSDMQARAAEATAEDDPPVEPQRSSDGR